MGAPNDAALQTRIILSAFELFAASIPPAIMRDFEAVRCSGHASKKSLEVYQHLSLTDVAPGYQAAVKGLGI